MLFFCFCRVMKLRKVPLIESRCYKCPENVDNSFSREKKTHNLISTQFEEMIDTTIITDYSVKSFYKCSGL